MATHKTSRWWNARLDLSTPTFWKDEEGNQVGTTTLDIKSDRIGHMLVSVSFPYSIPILRANAKLTLDARIPEFAYARDSNRVRAHYFNVKVREFRDGDILPIAPRYTVNAEGFITIIGGSVDFKPNDIEDWNTGRLMEFGIGSRYHYNPITHELDYDLENMFIEEGI